MNSDAATLDALDTPRALRLARDTLGIEADALQAMSQRLDGVFGEVVQRILRLSGRVVVMGMGKSGHVGRKVAATLASTGTPAFFVHPAEASHGDLGMVTGIDLVLALSNSGEADELAALLPAIKRQGIALVAMTGGAQSTLARHADWVLDTRVEREACPLNLAPTASTTAALALGDALAVACLTTRGFSPEDFARSHPGGALGRRLLTYVRDVMRHGIDLPIIRSDSPVSAALLEMTRKGMGMTVVVDDDRVVGIFTDGDLRRLIEREGDIRPLTVAIGMSRNPLSIGPDALATEAAALMDHHRKNQLLVQEPGGRLVGALHMHDLMAAKVL